MAKITRPACVVVTRRLEKVLPSRVRSTSKTSGSSGEPGRKKYAFKECGSRSSATVLDAAINVWAST